MKLGEYIRQLRESKDLSLREFAMRVDLSPAFISDIELGKRNPGKEMLGKIAEFFSLPVEEFEKYDERVPVEEVKKFIQAKPAASAAVGILLRKATEGNVTTEDMKKLMDEINRKND